MNRFVLKATVLVIIFVILWGFIGFTIGGPADVTGYALLLGPTFAIAGILCMAHDLRKRDNFGMWARKRAGHNRPG